MSANSRPFINQQPDPVIPRRLPQHTLHAAFIRNRSALHLLTIWQSQAPGGVLFEYGACAISPQRYSARRRDVVILTICSAFPTGTSISPAVARGRPFGVPTVSLHCRAHRLQLPGVCGVLVPAGWALWANAGRRHRAAVSLRAGETKKPLVAQ